MGLDLIPLNFPLGCGHGSEGHTPPKQTPPGADTPQIRHPPWEQTPPRSDTAPGADTPLEQTPSLGADTLPGSRHPPWEQTPYLGADILPGSRHPQDQTPPDQTPPGADTPTPWSRHPPRADNPWSRHPPDQTPPGADTPLQSRHPLETCCKACWDTTCNACWDTHPPVNRMTDTCKNITLATTSLRSVTRMHSSRMRTACLLPISRSMHCSWRWCTCPRRWVGVPAGGYMVPGMCTWSQGDVPDPGGVPIQGGVPGPREGCTWSRGVYLPGGCTWSLGLGVPAQGVYLVRGGVPAQVLPPVNRTGVKILPCPKLRLQAVKICS